MVYDDNDAFNDDTFGDGMVTAGPAAAGGMAGLLGGGGGGGGGAGARERRALPFALTTACAGGRRAVPRVRGTRRGDVGDRASSEIP